jgi:DNA repair exonuclease SbcCD ATPase subunit
MPELTEPTRIQELAAEIQRLKEELAQKKAEIRDLKRLLRREIDREFPPNLDEFSDRELDDYFRDCLFPIKEVVDPRPDPKALRSHRKVVGRPVDFLKRLFLRMTGFYVHLLLDDQARFNKLSANLSQALLIRLRRHHERLKGIEDKISGCEMGLSLLKNRLEDLQASYDKLRTRTPEPPPR